MSTRLAGQHELSTVGSAQNFTSASSAALITLSTDPKSDGPLMFQIVAAEDIHIRQGDSTVAATTKDPILYKRTYLKITVDDENQACLSFRWSSENPVPGTVQVWQTNAKFPGDGAST